MGASLPWGSFDPIPRNARDHRPWRTLGPIEIRLYLDWLGEAEGGFRGPRTTLTPEQVRDRIADCLALDDVVRSLRALVDGGFAEGPDKAGRYRVMPTTKAFPPDPDMEPSPRTDRSAQTRASPRVAGPAPRQSAPDSPCSRAHTPETRTPETRTCAPRPETETKTETETEKGDGALAPVPPQTHNPPGASVRAGEQPATAPQREKCEPAPPPAKVTGPTGGPAPTQGTAPVAESNDTGPKRPTLELDQGGRDIMSGAPPKDRWREQGPNQTPAHFDTSIRRVIGPGVDQDYKAQEFAQAKATVNRNIREGRVWHSPPPDQEAFNRGARYAMTTELKSRGLDPDAFPFLVGTEQAPH